MISRSLYWRSFSRDRIFLSLAILSVATLVLAMARHNPTLERSTIPLQLALTFWVVNVLFAVVTLRREPLLSYMFLTMAILLNSTLFFFFNYLLSLQAH